MTTPDPIPVHITGIAEGAQLAMYIPALAGQNKPGRRALTARSFTLTAADPVQQILPEAFARTEAWVITQTNDITIASSKANCLAGGNAAATIPHSDTAPFPLNTTDAVWATAGTLPTTVSVVAILKDGS